jgi:hypothetical protein
MGLIDAEKQTRVSVRPDPSNPANPTISPLPIVMSIGAIEPSRPNPEKSHAGKKSSEVRSLSC